MPAELLVGFRPGAGPPDIAAVYQLHGLEERETLDPRGGATALRRVVFPLAAGENLEEQTQRVISRLMRHPRVRFAEPNYIFHTSELPNEPRFGEFSGSTTPARQTDAPTPMWTDPRRGTARPAALKPSFS